jgi:hypothetical protein
MVLQENEVMICERATLAHDLDKIGACRGSFGNLEAIENGPVAAFCI